MPPRTLAQLFRANLDRAVIPVDEDGDALFSADNPGYINDEVMRATIPTIDEILEEVEEIDDHVHNDELWWGSVAVPTQDTACESNVDRPFTLASGNDTWGVAVPIIGRLDNPVKSWQTKFDLHRVAISEVDNATPWKIRFLYGNQSLEEAAQAQRWTETMSIASGIGSNIGAGPSDMRMPILPVGWIVWAQCWNATLNDTISFFVGAHGYPVRSLH